MEGRLFRSVDDRMLGGVCGGLGKFLAIDPTFIRIIFFVLTFGGGAGFWIYLLLWFLIPEEDKDLPQDYRERVRTMGEDFNRSIRMPHPKSSLIVGGGLIIIGIFWFVEQLHIKWLWWWDFDLIWPGLLIVIGCLLLYRWMRDRGVMNK
jgi:phage shock protein PspC (stress-responsive transcriptional regulator)